MLKVAPVPTHEAAESFGEGAGPAPPVPVPSLLAPTEMSCDWLFGVAAQPMLIVDARDRILRANVAAARLLHVSPTTLEGSALAAAFAVGSTRELAAALCAARVTGSAKILSTPARAGAAQLTCALSLVVAERGSYILVHLDAEQHRQPGSPSVVGEAIENASFGFLLTDAHLHVEYANRAFLQMIEVDSPAEVHGQPLARWLGLSSDDLAQLHEQMSARRAVSTLFLRLAPEHGPVLEVEAAAVAVPRGDAACWGLSIRRRPRLS
jgi:PAS domain-containing protein